MLTAGLCATPVRAEALPQTQTVQAININAEGAEYLHDGYVSVDSWNQVKQEKIDSFVSLREEIHGLSGYVDSETMAELDGIDTTTFRYIEDVENQITRFAEVKTQAEQAKATAEADAKRRAMNIQQQQQTSATYTYGGNSGGLTKQSGVNYHNGRRETYYSSNVLYHYRTPEWTVDSEGFYRDSNGNYIVAVSDMPQGTIFQGSKGNCIVADSGCASGTTDYYTQW